MKKNLKELSNSLSSTSTPVHISTGVWTIFSSSVILFISAALFATWTGPGPTLSSDLELFPRLKAMQSR